MAASPSSLLVFLLSCIPTRTPLSQCSKTSIKLLLSYPPSALGLLFHVLARAACVLACHFSRYRLLQRIAIRIEAIAISPWYPVCRGE